MDFKEVKELIRFFDKSGVSELELEEGDMRIYLSKVSPTVDYSQSMPHMMPHMMHHMMPGMVAQPAIPCAPETAAKADDKGVTIDSPMIGTFYEAPSPGAPSFVKVGDVVEKGQTVCIIEAMKIMNTIEADFKCKILQTLIDNGSPVEYGQAIFVVEPL